VLTGCEKTSRSLSRDPAEEQRSLGGQSEGAGLVQGALELSLLHLYRTGAGWKTQGLVHVRIVESAPQLVHGFATRPITDRIH
jgi:hypothetical protein